MHRSIKTAAELLTPCHSFREDEPKKLTGSQIAIDYAEEFVCAYTFRKFCTRLQNDCVSQSKVLQVSSLIGVQLLLVYAHAYLVVIISPILIFCMVI